ncbi:phosphate ABC transporter substrate-binding protein PstS [Rhodococcus sp. D2-41]|uniref:Phosphate-binding protein n=1 Tax=Speluncibacter jeojiensis TaxID=2710754 RepID=A0A9X4RHF7_9ACTN|nr:phosphate ABC transporter substrate-binding protein PstS [Rhodococcus sp. D2-41]MDG3011608.1 phosphate ABC transporter substrate-binding protein PstS [Rhodococcus sp. D2-41]MDG3015036.1 phosphate ABC transporter substrate-binding protein PstS [Corynebacteriales bacterium D3-21]
MNLKRSSALVGLVGVVAVASLTACGSDNNAASSASGSVTPASSASCAGKDKLSAAGSSAQKNAMDQFTAKYIEVCNSKGKSKNVAYTASGSGDGRTQFIAKQIDFAGSDSAIKGDQAAKAKQRCAGTDAWNLPMVFGPVAMAYNLPGVDNLVLNGETIAKIFDGSVKNWNDPAIAALNPGVKLPDQQIGVVYRSDSSGTTDNFQTYLTAASHGAWTKGAGSDFVGGVGNGSKGSAGVAQAVRTTPGSIAYVEESFAAQNKLQTASLDSGSGPVALSTEAAAKSVAAAKFANPASDDLTLDLKAMYSSNEPGAYPLVLASYDIVCSKGYDADTAEAVKSFLTSAANEGQQGLGALGYVPLPDTIKTKLMTSINAIAPAS